jgi:accessory colonization factor AcfC
MATTFTKIAAVTVGSGGAASISFTSIPQTYTDLIVKVSSRKDAAAVWSNITSIALNGSTANQTSRNLLNIDGSAASNSLSSFPYWTVGNTATSNTFSNSEFYIPNYTSSNYKSISFDSTTENNATSVLQQLSAYLWSSTAAITSITFNGDNFMQYSTATLYGVKNS